MRALATSPDLATKVKASSDQLVTEPFKDAHISFEKQKTINESKPPTENESPPAAQDAQKSKMAALAASQAISDSKQYQAPNSLDLFALETRARRTIGELIRPII